MPIYPFPFLLYKDVFEKLEKNLQSGSFREGRSGYSKHNFFFSPVSFESVFIAINNIKKQRKQTQN